jgi:hypothetical protein
MGTPTQQSLRPAVGSKAVEALMLLYLKSCAWHGIFV